MRQFFFKKGYDEDNFQTKKTLEECQDRDIFILFLEKDVEISGIFCLDKYIHNVVLEANSTLKNSTFLKNRIKKLVLLEGSLLDSCSFSNVLLNITGHSCRIQKTRFSNCKIHNPYLSKVEIKNTVFSNSKLLGKKVDTTLLIDTVFTRTSITGCSLENITMTGCTVDESCVVEGNEIINLARGDCNIAVDFSKKSEMFKKRRLYL